MADSIKSTVLSSGLNQPETPTHVVPFNFKDKNQSPEKREVNFEFEKEKLMKEKKELKKEYEKQLTQKSNKINDLLTDLQNQQTDLDRSKLMFDKLGQDNQRLQEQYSSLRQKLDENERLIESEKKNR